MFDQFSFKKMKQRYERHANPLKTNIKTSIPSPKMPTDSAVTQPEEDANSKKIVESIDKLFEEIL